MNRAEILRLVQNGTLTPGEAARRLAESLTVPNGKDNRANADLTSLMYRPVWRLTPVLQDRHVPSATTSIFFEESESGDIPVMGFAQLFQKVLGKQAIATPIAGLSQADFEAILGPYSDMPAIVFLYRPSSCDLLSLESVRDMQTRALYPLLRLIRAIYSRWGAAAASELKIITFDNHSIIGSELGFGSSHAKSTGAALAGVARVLHREYPGLRVSTIDLDTSDLSWSRPEEAAALAARVLADPGEQAGGNIAWRHGRRFVQSLEMVEPLPSLDASPMLTPNGVVAIAGGAGGIGSTIAKWLSAQYQSRLVLIGRRAVNSEIQQLLGEISSNGGEAVYFQADITDPDQTLRAVNAGRDRFGTLDAVIHSAIVLGDCALHSATEESFRRVLAPKLEGSINFARAAIEGGAKLLAFFSSANVFYGNPGQANYVAGCAFKDALARKIAASYPIEVKLLNWGFWDEVGIVASADYKSRMDKLGVSGITPTIGCAAFDRVMRSSLEQVVLIRCGLEMRKELAVPNEHPAQQMPNAHNSALREAMKALRGSNTPDVSLQIADALTALEELSRMRLLAAFREIGDTEIPATEGSAKQLRDALIPVWQVAKANRELVERSLRWEAETDIVRKRFPELSPHLALLEACVASYPQLWRGEVAGHEILFPNGSSNLVAPVYSGSDLAESMNRTVGSALEAWQEARGHTRPLRILEIGAGTGSTAAVLLQLFENVREFEYVFTDVSSALVRQASEKFGRYSRCSFRLLDIDRDPALQGFEPGTFDVVVASNVLHATCRMSDTLARAKKLLRTNGLLALIEATSSQVFTTMTFGVTNGWWQHDTSDMRLPGGPLLDRSGWEANLVSAGFRGIEAIGFGGTNGTAPYHAIFAESDGWVYEPETNYIVARSRHEAPVTPPAPSINGTTLAATLAALKNIFARVLKMAPSEIRTEATFESLGVDSLTVLQLTEQIEREYGKLSKTLLYEYPTLNRLAAHLNQDGKHQSPPPVASEQSAKHQSPPPVASEQSAKHQSSPPVASEQSAKLPSRQGQTMPIAIVGVAGRYPKGGTLEEFWTTLAEGRSAIQEVPRDRFDFTPFFDPRGGERKSYSKWGGFISDADKFDASFFGISPREAKDMDPQERVFLETVWACLEDAGYPPRRLKTAAGGRGRNDVGIFAGITYGTYQLYAIDQWNNGDRAGAHSSFWSIANRVSWLFDFQGPSMAIDTACSSSLAAIHQACESIRRGECNAALAGGVNLILHPLQLVGLSQLRMLAPDDKCRAFGLDANGFVDGEGVGVVLIRPLADAIADGDRIRGVILGSAMNSSGRTSGYTVPNPAAHASLILDAIDRSGVNPNTIGYVEAHGTGTALGDPIEIAGLTKAWREHTQKSGFCAIGSVKSNIGHLESAAGVAGLTKILLQFQHKEIAPSLHGDRTNPLIEFETTPFHLQTQRTPWESSSGPRRAALSSFGAGGANIHAIVEEFEAAAVDNRPVEPNDELIILSAKSRKALLESAERLRSLLESNATDSHYLGDVAWTLQIGREAMDYRLAFVAASKSECLDRLRDLAEQEASADSFFEGRVKIDAATDESDNHEYILQLWNDKRYRKIASLWVAGVEPDWAKLPRNGTRRIVSLPSYPFDRVRYWPVAIETLASLESTTDIDTAGACRTFVPSWFVLPERPSPTIADGRHAILQHSNSAIGSALAGQYQDCVVISLNRSDWLDRLENETSLSTIDFLGAIDSCDWQDAVDDSLPLLHLIQHLARWKSSPPLLRIVTMRAQKALPSDRLAKPWAATSIGLGRACRIELPSLPVVCVDVEGKEPEAEAARIASEWNLSQFVEVAWRGGERWVRGIEEVPEQTLESEDSQQNRLREGGVYVVVGGASGVGLEISRWMATKARARVVLIGRSQFGDRQEAAIQTIREQGGDAIYIQADVTDRGALRRAIDETRRKFGPIAGAIHSAMVLLNQPLATMSDRTYETVLAPKVAGSAAFAEALRGEKPDFVLFFSSLASLAPTPGSANYAAACAFEDAFACYLQDSGKFPAQTIDWGFWGDVGQLATAEGRARLAQLGVQPMGSAAGIQAFSDILRLGLTQTIPLRASAKVLELLGLRDNVRPVLGKLEATCAAAAKEEEQSSLDLKQGEMALRDLDSLSRLYLTQVWAQLGMFPQNGESLNRDTLRSRASLLPKYERLLEAHLSIFAAHKLIRFAGSDILEGSELGPTLAGRLSESIAREHGAFLHQHPDMGGFARVLEACLKPDDYAAVLGGRKLPTELLFPSSSPELVTGMYRNNPWVEHYNRLLAEALADFAHSFGQSEIRVLELGSGTGSTSEFTLRKLDSFRDRVTYDFTDVSRKFLQEGKAAFGTRYPFVNFRQLDLEQSPDQQGFEAESYDAVIATNVVHATRSIRRSLQHISRLLKPGGLLLLNELTHKSDFQTITVALLDGWWAFEDADLRIENSPLLLPDRWMALLQEAGFRKGKAFGTPYQQVFAVERGDRQSAAEVALVQDRGARVPGASRPKESATREKPSIEAIARRIGAIAAAVLEMDAVPETDKVFAEMGVDSILAPQIANRMNEEFKTAVTPTDFYSYPSPLAMAAWISSIQPQFKEQQPPPTDANNGTAIAAIGIPTQFREQPTEQQPPPTDANNGTAIAVIGLSCRLPGARDAEQFWEVLQSAREAYSDLAGERWGDNPSRPVRGGLLPEALHFDPFFFRISPREAVQMDPQQRVFLEETWKAIEDAGYSPESLANTKCGVYAGAAQNFYGLTASDSGAGADSMSSIGTSMAMLPARVSYHLNLKGPAIPVDTACSSSLVAVHLACQGLLNGDCDTALAGGVAILLLSPTVYKFLDGSGMISASNRCRPFDKDADGFVPGEGAGVVMLKRLTDALRDGDHIYGVIRASGINQDGRSNGITAPNAQAQSELETAVYEKAQIDPETISYVETHGTGTKLGDPIELAALTGTFRKWTEAKQFCAIGSVKSNIGHTMAAAGIAGLIKILLSLKHSELPASVNFQEPNPPLIGILLLSMLSAIAVRGCVQQQGCGAQQSARSASAVRTATW